MRVSAPDTNGEYSVVEIVSSPGDSTPMHVHQNEDEGTFWSWKARHVSRAATKHLMPL
jgi:hypothetical protein